MGEVGEEKERKAHHRLLGPGAHLPGKQRAPRGEFHLYDQSPLCSVSCSLSEEQALASQCSRAARSL